ncbi:transposase, C-ter fragment, truncated protein [Escherichia coli]|nr:transposase, C-ter fragment, truncated protein [Escherichia coli]SQZ59544.1 transposase, C-ter fragment, truncated protein [Escherichia coli]
MILWSVKKETDIRRGRHCVFLMHVHLLFVTRYRRQIFDHDATEKLRTYFSNVCAYFEAELVEMDGEPGNDSNLLIVFYVQIMPDDFVMQLHRF